MAVAEEPRQAEERCLGERVSPARHSSATTEFAVIRRAEELDDWRGAWSTLDAAARSPMETLAWIEAAAATWADDGEVEVVIGQQDGQVVAAAPLLRLGGWPVGRWHALNYHRVYEPADLIYQDDRALADLIAELVLRGRPIFLERLFASAPSAAYLQGPLARRALTLVRPQANTPWIALDEGWSSPEQKLSSRRRSDFRRSLRTAQQLGQVTTEHHTPAEDEVARLLELAFEVERRSWKGKTGTALAVDRSGEFYRRYARHATREGKLRISFLRIGHEVAAMQLGIVHRERYWVLKVGYDQQFHRASPGILLMVEAIKQARADGLVAYELLGTVEPWIQVWTELEHACVSLRVYPTGVGGIMALTSDLVTKSFSRRRKRP